jgi:hypothetical protein
MLTAPLWGPPVDEWRAAEITPKPVATVKRSACPEWAPGMSRTLVVLIDEETGAVQCLRVRERGMVQS